MYNYNRSGADFGLLLLCIHINWQCLTFPSVRPGPSSGFPGSVSEGLWSPVQPTIQACRVQMVTALTQPASPPAVQGPLVLKVGSSGGIGAQHITSSWPVPYYDHEPCSLKTLACHYLLGFALPSGLPPPIPKFQLVPYGAKFSSFFISPFTSQAMLRACLSRP